MSQPINNRLVVPGWSDEDRAEVQQAIAQLRELLAPREQPLLYAIARAHVFGVTCLRLIGHLEWLLDRLAADHDADSSRSGAA